ncbi:MAG TPA: NADH-ubiquinone oxidoreductase-F iron-sulfur binding region domain-containing protein [Syntrophorhabdales bacterium]|nr:NADH-ubiquinone oxidoreductase-F iron-sulfur binding region domain-containing protein [Syntrophorhabdales bacterium]
MPLSLEQLDAVGLKFKEKERAFEKIIRVCCGTGCITSGANRLLESLRSAVEREGLSSRILVKKTGCHGLCERGPIVTLGKDEILYQTVGKRDLDRDVELLLKTATEGKIADLLLLKAPGKKEKFVSPLEIPFYKGQKRVVLEMNGVINPEEIDDYIAHGGYRAPFKAFQMTQEKIIDCISASGLRGRGGGGFPTGRKWHSAYEADGQMKYLLANGDEGDPGAFMDRSLMEGNPHAIIEGMIIGGYAIGSNKGYIYVRDEYPLAVSRLSRAIEQAQNYGILGRNVFGSDFEFDVEIFRGGGAFVCGESTALMSSVEGRAGEPRDKYVHTVEQGLWAKPTNLNNVETWANVPSIINEGLEWYTSIGTKQSKGTKIFSLVGKVNNTGLIEVPMGITLRQIIFDLGGGIRGRRRFKAVQTGGPSGGCIPEQYLDMPVDFDSLASIGSMMGSGGMIVMDERDCMVDVARYFLQFLMEESCGKCTPCREGTRRMYEILDRICKGEGKIEDLMHLEELGRGLQWGAICGLGQTAPNPVLSTIRYFSDEYKAHIIEGRCPAGVCKDITTFTIMEDKCTGCMRCAAECPVGAVVGERKAPQTINDMLCITCGICYDVCPFDAVKIS